MNYVLIQSKNFFKILYYKSVCCIFIYFALLYDFSSRDNIEKKGLRAPRGFSEAMLREENEESCVEDLESIVSSLGVGRGKIALKSNQLKLVGLGRGKPLDDF